MLEKWKKIRSDPLDLFLNLVQFIISIWVTAIGIFLFGDNHYFFWPPTYKNVENDMRIDALIILIGLVLFLCTIFNVQNKWIIAILFSLIGAVSLCLATLSFMHAWFAGFLPMGLNVIGYLMLFSLTLLVGHFKLGVIRLHDLSNLIASLATLIGAVSAFYQVIIKTKRNPPNNQDLDRANKEITRLKRELKKEKNKNENRNHH